MGILNGHKIGVSGEDPERSDFAQTIREIYDRASLV